jgi:hypothetical protein
MALDPDQPFKLASKQAQKLTQSHDPNAWVTTSLPHTTLWSAQRQILQALQDHHRVAVRSCHDSGKSFIAAIAAARWLDVHPATTARVITTAPTAMQVKGILWVELNQLKAQADLPGRMNQTEWWIGSYLAGMGRKPSDYNPAAFQGMHARYLLIIVDEASGVTSSLIDAVETLATNTHARILMIGNPDDPTSLFADIHNNPQKHGYHCIRISAWDTPNFTDEGDTIPQELKEVLLSPEWVEQRRKAWGEQHPFWLSKVEAEFPPIDTLSTIKLVDIVKARVPFNEREREPNSTSPSGVSTQPGVANAHAQMSTVLGVDVAGSDTGDETVIRLVTTTPQGYRPTTEWRYRTSDPNEVTDNIVSAIISTMPQQVVIDSIGVGFGIIAAVRSHEAITNLPPATTPTIIGFNASNAPRSKEYGNQRAELWWGARILFQDGRIDTSAADDQLTLEAQLLQPRYFIKKGKIWIEAKEDIKSRIGRSPDNADAFLYALWPALKSTQLSIVAPPRNAQLIQRHMQSTAVMQRLVKQR